MINNNDSNISNSNNDIDNDDDNSDKKTIIMIKMITMITTITTCTCSSSYLLLLLPFLLTQVAKGLLRLKDTRTQFSATNNTTVVAMLIRNSTNVLDPTVKLRPCFTAPKYGRSISQDTY